MGLAAIFIGVGITTLTSTYSLWFLLIGPVVQGLGWLVLPSALWRRILVVLPCMIAGLVPVAGTDFVGAFAALLAAWLLVRHRPVLSFLLVAVPIILSVWVKFAMHDNAASAPAILLCSAVTVATAWLAREFARAWATRRAVRVPAEQ